MCVCVFSFTFGAGFRGQAEVSALCQAVPGAVFRLPEVIEEVSGVTENTAGVLGITSRGSSEASPMQVGTGRF